MSDIYEEMHNYRIACCEANAKVRTLEAANAKLKDGLEFGNELYAEMQQTIEGLRSEKVELEEYVTFFESLTQDKNIGVPGANRPSLKAYVEEIEAANAKLKEELKTKELVEKRLRLSWKEECETIAKLKEERDEWRNKCVMAEDDNNYYHSIFDGSWPTAIETLKATLKALEE